MEKINIYEIPVLEILEEVLETKTKLKRKEVEKIVLEFGKALVEAHKILKERAHDERTEESEERRDKT